MTKQILLLKNSTQIINSLVQSVKLHAGTTCRMILITTDQTVDRFDPFLKKGNLAASYITHPLTWPQNNTSILPSEITTDTKHI